MYYDSWVLSFLYKIYMWFYKYLEESLSYKFVISLSKKIKSYLHESFIIKLISRKSFISSNWENSSWYKIIEHIINIPVYILRKIYLLIFKYIQDSYCFKLLNFIAVNSSYILGFALFAIIITPHAYSYNYLMGGIIFLTLIVLVIKKAMTKNTNLSIKGLGFYLIIFSFSVILQTVFSVFPNLSMRDLLLYFICFACLIVVVNAIKDKKDFSNIIEMILIAVSITGVYGIYQKISGIPINPSQIDLTLNAQVGSRAYSNMANPNNLAQVYVLFIPFYLSVITASKTMLKKLIFSALLLPVFITLLLTASRSGWIGCAIAVVIFIYYKNKKLLPFFFIAALVAIPFLPESIYVRLTTIFNLNDSSTSYRFLIMESVLPALRDFGSTGMGLGANTFMKIIGNYELLTDVVPPHSHNLLLQLWLELGIIGMLSFVALIFNLFKRSVKSIVKTKNSYSRDMTIAGFSSIVGILVISIAEYIWYYPRVMMLFFIAIALLISSIKLSYLDKT